MIVYKIINTINDKVYVGITAKSLEERYHQHLRQLSVGNDRRLYCAMRELGVENFSIVQIDTANSYDELLEKEVYYVHYYDSKNNGYNMTDGGDVNPMDDEIVQKKHLEKMNSADVKTKISVKMKENVEKGVIFTPEHRKNLSEAAKKRRVSENSKYKDSKNVSSSGYVGGTTGLKLMYNLENKRKYVNPSDVDYYISIGWRLPVNKKKNKNIDFNDGQIHFYKRHKSQQEVHDNLSKSHLGHSPSNKGVPLSEETKLKISLSLKGNKWMNDGHNQILVKSYEIDSYIEKGYTYGKIKSK